MNIKSIEEKILKLNLKFQLYLLKRNKLKFLENGTRLLSSTPDEKMKLDIKIKSNREHEIVLTLSKYLIKEYELKNNKSNKVDINKLINKIDKLNYKGLVFLSNEFENISNLVDQSIQRYNISEEYKEKYDYILLNSKYLSNNYKIQTDVTNITNGIQIREKNLYINSIEKEGKLDIPHKIDSELKISPNGNDKEIKMKEFNRIKKIYKELNSKMKKEFKKENEQNIEKEKLQKNNDSLGMLN